MGSQLPPASRWKDLCNNVGRFSKLTESDAESFPCPDISDVVFDFSEKGARVFVPVLVIGNLYFTLFGIHNPGFFEDKSIWQSELGIRLALVEVAQNGAESDVHQLAKLNAAAFPASLEAVRAE
jgi:hypothetical protein